MRFWELFLKVEESLRPRHLEGPTPRPIEAEKLQSFQDRRRPLIHFRESGSCLEPS